RSPSERRICQQSFLRKAVLPKSQNGDTKQGSSRCQHEGSSEPKESCRWPSQSAEAQGPDRQGTRAPTAGSAEKQTVAVLYGTAHSRRPSQGGGKWQETSSWTAQCS